MRIVNWDDNDMAMVTFDKVDKQVDQDILVAILSMDEKQRKNRWDAKICKRPKLGVHYIELRKTFDGSQVLMVIGKSPSKYQGLDNFRKGKAKISMNGAAFYTPFELHEMSLAAAEAEAVWDCLHEQIEFKKSER